MGMMGTAFKWTKLVLGLDLVVEKVHPEHLDRVAETGVDVY